LVVVTGRNNPLVFFSVVSLRQELLYDTGSSHSVGLHLAEEVVQRKTVVQRGAETPTCTAGEASRRGVWTDGKSGTARIVATFNPVKVLERSSTFCSFFYKKEISHED
jgi:hypothetical protein